VGSFVPFPDGKEAPVTDASGSGKPSYLGLLNAIAVAESRACEYLNVWIGVTRRDDVASVLRTVAAREGEHGMAFAKRIDELGYQVRIKDDERHGKALEIAGADCSDLEKMQALGLDRLDTGAAPDIFDKFFTDHTIDVRTGELLGRYIAEERDSGRLLRRCYEQLRAECEAATESSGARADDERLDDERLEQLERLEAKIDTVCRAVDELRDALTMQNESNGTKKPARAKA
jgi:hypothetical protein